MTVAGGGQTGGGGGGTTPPTPPSPAPNNQQQPQPQTPQQPTQQTSSGFDPSPNPMTQVRSVNPPLTPDQIIGVYNTPIQKPALPTLKLQDIKVPNIKNRTLQSHLKSIEAKMIMTEKLMKDIIKFQKHQIISEKELNERRRELYQNTFEEYLLDKTIDFRDDDNPDCICINLPKTPKPGGMSGGARTPTPTPTPSPTPTPQTPAQTPATEPSKTPAPKPTPTPSPVPSTPGAPPKPSTRPSWWPSFIPWPGSPSPSPSPAPSNPPHRPGQPSKPSTTPSPHRPTTNPPGTKPPAVPKTPKVPPIIEPVEPLDPDGPGPLEPVPIPEPGVQPVNVTPAYIQEYVTAAQQRAKEINQSVTLKHSSSGWSVTSTADGRVEVVSPEESARRNKDIAIGTAVFGLTMAPSMFGAGRTKAGSGTTRPTTGLVNRPRPNTYTIPPTVTGANNIVNFTRTPQLIPRASGAAGDLELYNTQSQNYFRNISSQASQMASNISPNLFAQSKPVKTYGGGGWLQQLGRFLPGTGTVMAPKTMGNSTVAGYQDQLLGVPIGKTRYPRDSAGYGTGYSQPEMRRYEQQNPKKYFADQGGPLPALINRSNVVGDAFANFGNNVNTIQNAAKRQEEMMRQMGYEPDGYVNLLGQPIKKKASGGITNYAGGGIVNFSNRSNVINKSSFFNDNYTNNTQISPSKTSSNSSMNTNNTIPRKINEQKISLKLEQSQQQMNQNGPVTPTVIPLPPDYISIPMPSSNSKESNADSLLQPPGQDDIIPSIFSIESGKYG